ncbi:hypothetical protein [Cryobacterium sp. Y82]|uniref:hypothetical protein n=1 Tax=Cryobacterium sp. Y82 TaxID=2045017 RepID=UPI00130494F4|nr:hypothetical protein [Cryobacterium sp. Y82]
MMVQVTERDEALLAWLDVVRLADMDAVRWALGALSGAGEPVSLRRAQQWAARMIGTGLLDRGRVAYRDGSIVWATYLAIGKPAPNLFRQTTRHEVAVATVSARYLAQGFTWRRDRKPNSVREHQADGVAERDGVVELVEVELTPKTWQRYQSICQSHAYRLAHEGIDRIAYFCTADADRAVTREADKHLVRTDRPRFVSQHSLDARGYWTGDELGAGAHATAHGRATLLVELESTSEWGESSQVHA